MANTRHESALKILQSFLGSNKTKDIQDISCNLQNAIDEAKLGEKKEDQGGVTAQTKFIDRDVRKPLLHLLEKEQNKSSNELHDFISVTLLFICRYWPLEKAISEESRRVLTLRGYQYDVKEESGYWSLEGKRGTDPLERERDLIKEQLDSIDQKKRKKCWGAYVGFALPFALAIMAVMLKSKNSYQNSVSESLPELWKILLGLACFVPIGYGLGYGFGSLMEEEETPLVRSAKKLIAEVEIETQKEACLQTDECKVDVEPDSDSRVKNQFRK